MVHYIKDIFLNATVIEEWHYCWYFCKSNAV
jgi:hypothetical protein